MGDESEDEIQSPPSPEPGSSASPNQNGRTTVTIAQAPPSPPQQDALNLALPIHQPASKNRNGTSVVVGGRDDCWTEAATAVLIGAWGERYLEASRGNLKQKHWQEVAEIVASRDNCSMKTKKTDVQCKNRIDTVKKKYKFEKSKIAAGGGLSNWPFFQLLEHLIGPKSKPFTLSPAMKFPFSVPVGIRSTPHHHQKRNQDDTDSDSSRSLGNESPDSNDRSPPATVKRAKIETDWKQKPVPCRDPVERRGMGNSMRELTEAIVRFGEVYERAEKLKMRYAMEMEKQMMKFGKDLELQRAQFLMKAQMEISQLKKHGGTRSGYNNHTINGNNKLDVIYDLSGSSN